ncbi:MAG: hypothetical protein ACXWGT_07975 [Usitatibacter sp.]
MREQGCADDAIFAKTGSSSGSIAQEFTRCGRAAQVLDFLLVAPETDARILGKARAIAEHRPESEDAELAKLVHELRELLDERDSDLASIS